MWRASKGRRWRHLDQETLAARFSAIYEHGVWRVEEGDHTPGSGSGSSLTATQQLRKALPQLLDDLKAKTLVDIGCGDFTWMQQVALSQRYVGVDVVEAVIESNRKQHARPGREFVNADATEDEIPDGDVVLLREILFHLSFADIKRLLGNVLSKPRDFIIATSDGDTLFNSDISTGEFRLLNLAMRPLKFPTPLQVIPNGRVAPHRILGVWGAQSLRALELR